MIDTSQKSFRSTALARLQDPRLFREFSYIDGRWRAAASGDTLMVNDPSDQLGSTYEHGGKC